MKKPICKILRTHKNNNFKFTIRFLTLNRSYIGYLGFLGIDFLKSILLYFKGAICLSRLLFKMSLFTVWSRRGHLKTGNTARTLYRRTNIATFCTLLRKCETCTYSRNSNCKTSPPSPTFLFMKKIILLLQYNVQLNC
jgi:hypothetical protein